MNQRIVSCPSTLFTKGFTLKAGDWRISEATPETLDQKPTVSKSVASLSNSWKLAKNNSSSSFRKQFDGQCLSSSSLSSVKTDRSFNLNSSSSKGNATWDDKAVSGLAPKPTDSSRLSVSLFDLVQLKMDDPFKQQGNNTKRPHAAVPETTAKNAGSRNDRKRSSLSDLVTLKEEDEPFRSYSVYTAKNASCDEKEYDISSLEKIPKISPSTEDFSEFLVKTFHEKRPKQIDVRLMSSSDLSSLKEKDPFMYFSIPTVRSAAINGNDVDLKAMKDDAISSKVPSRYERKTCISFESCLIPELEDSDLDDIDSCSLPSLTNVFYNMSMEIDEKIDFDDDDWLYSYCDIQTAN
ncbi:hypothetical protein HJC23_009684 [Cyclotella cryptica]|uniref:Uncharacterized protein n=1 Tax=Cyclotella cryptica TaxID=29204 RepID=A0ABD3Q7W1_9STRA|eukprot:CCRYP_007629-RA/>CCRYP_007629-RA protein AED:0.22 eAED:0.22 QI:0/-1/0/1/-1/1/1/0/350